MIRKIVNIDEDKCNGCGLCIPNCAEGAIKIIDGKAKLISDNLCDGLGACLGHCPQDAITVIECDADEFDEEAVHKVQNIHQPNHNHHVHSGGCPGSRMRMLSVQENSAAESLCNDHSTLQSMPSQLRQWPVQLMLVPVNAPYFENADLLITADCVPFAYAGYHNDLLKGKIVLIGCPKLDDVEYYAEKLAQIIQNNNLNSITVAHMEVPCCSGIVRAVEKAIHDSGKTMLLNKVQISIDGKKM